MADHTDNLEAAVDPVAMVEEAGARVSRITHNNDPVGAVLRLSSAVMIYAGAAARWRAGACGVAALGHLQHAPEDGAGPGWRECSHPACESARGVISDLVNIDSNGGV